MTIEFKRGNILAEDVEALVNPVNCVGVMGKGLALQFKNFSPENFEAYKLACKYGEVEPGILLMHETYPLINPSYIINFPTKRHWRDKSKMEDIVLGLVDLVDFIRVYDIKSIAIPALGCGLGGLEWVEVKKLIESNLHGLDGVRIVVFEPREK